MLLHCKMDCSNILDATVNRPTPHSLQNNVSLYKVIYLLTKHKLSCFVQKCVFIVAMVTGLLLGLQVSGGGCVLIEMERL